ncbi:hypothetical protein Tco_1049993 [Tanacetum coccineum]
MSAFNLNMPICSASFIVHSESALGNDDLVVSIAKANPGKFTPSTDLYVLADQTKSVSEGFKDLDSPEDDLVIVVDDSDEDKEDEVYTTTKDTSVLKSSSPRSSQIQELTNQVLIHQSQKHKLKLEKNKAEAKVAILKAQPSFPNELLAEFVSLPVHVASIQAKLKTLDALPGLLLNVIKALNKFAQVLGYASSKAGDQSVPLTGQADTMPAEGEKNTNQVTISYQAIAVKEKTRDHNLPKSSSQPEGEHIKKDKGKKTMSSEEAEKESTNNDSNDDDETHVTGSTVEPSTTKKLKKFDFITKDGRNIYLTEEEINHQKKLEEDAKAEAAKQEGEVRKAEVVYLLGPEVVNKYYNDKLQYDRYCDKMLNRKAESRITNYDVLTKKGLITLKLYRKDGTSEVIPNFKASDMHLGE